MGAVHSDPGCSASRTPLVWGVGGGGSGGGRELGGTLPRAWPGCASRRRALAGVSRAEKVFVRGFETAARRTGSGTRRGKVRGDTPGTERGVIQAERTPGMKVKEREMAGFVQST